MDMWENSGGAEPPATGWPAFVGSWSESLGQARVLLRGKFDAEPLERLRAQLEALLSSGARFIIVDATGVTGCDPGILELLGATQRRLHRRHGLLTLRGLHPCVLSAEASSDHRRALSSPQARGETLSAL